MFFLRIKTRHKEDIFEKKATAQPLKISVSWNYKTYLKKYITHKVVDDD